MDLDILRRAAAARQRSRNAVYEPHLKPIPETDAVVRQQLDKLVAAAFRLDETLLEQPTRGKARVARARQVAMYLAHTVCGYSLTHVGTIFGRDRTTVAHACAVIEECREDRDFDRAVEMLERSTRILQVHAVWVGAKVRRQGR